MAAGRTSWMVALGALAAGLLALPAEAASAPRQAQAARAQAPTAREVLVLMRRVGDWQLGHLQDFGYIRTFRDQTAEPLGWVQGAFWVGMSQLAETSGEPRYRDAIVAKGRAENWSLGPRPYHADDFVIGRSWLWAAEHAGQRQAIPAVRARLDRILAAPRTMPLDFSQGAQPGQACSDRWCWCDALFMAPPVWAEMSRLTGDPKYLAFADREWWATTDALYDRDSRLYYRDSRFIGQRGPNGEKIFWSRGNGWVLGGLVAMLQSMPRAYPSRPRYERLYREMAARLITLQRPDGYWPSSLEGGAGPSPETSGTGFFVYGLAWGINAGLLDRATYGPAVERGWRALAAAVHPDGKLGWVQQVGDSPDHVTADDTQLFGVGAFLLAGGEVRRLQGRGRS